MCCLMEYLIITVTEIDRLVEAGLHFYCNNLSRFMIFLISELGVLQHGGALLSLRKRDVSCVKKKRLFLTISANSTVSFCFMDFTGVLEKGKGNWV